MGEDLRDPWFDTLGAPCDSRTVLHFCMPHQVARIPGKINVNFTMFEATRVPASWIIENRRHELVIVPTESSRLAWIESGFPEHRLRLCPLGINPEIFNGEGDPRALRLGSGVPVGQHRIRLLHVSELSPRKNVIGLLEAWTLATSPSDNAVLILKLGCYALETMNHFREQVKSMEQRIGKRLFDAAPMLVLTEMLADAQMPALYRAATHYISMSFGEGWDQTMMEAGASGLKLIAPDHSAYREYLDPSIATLLPTHETPVVYAGDPATGALFEGASWWQPDQQAAIGAIRCAIDGCDQSIGLARPHIIQNYTWEKATQRLIGILGELESLRAKIPIFSGLPSSNHPATATKLPASTAPKASDRS